MRAARCGSDVLGRADRIELGAALAVLAGTLALRPDSFLMVAFVLPLVVAVARRESPAAFAGPLAPGRALLHAAVVLAITLPLVPLGVTLGWVEWRPSVPGARAVVGIVAAAAVEEWLFRGYLQDRLERAFPPRRRLLGAPIGLAWVLTALAFGLAHIGRLGPLDALARVAPGLVLGHCRARAGSIWPGTIVHAVYNVCGGLIAR